MKLTIVIPAYNEASTIVETIERVRKTPFEKEILVIDDGSTEPVPAELGRGRGWALPLGLTLALLTLGAALAFTLTGGSAPKSLPSRSVTPQAIVLAPVGWSVRPRSELGTYTWTLELPAAPKP